MSDFDFNDLTIVTTPTGQIKTIRGERLPAGLIYAPIEPDARSSISASAMRAMSAALYWAQDAQNRARQSPASECD